MVRTILINCIGILGGKVGYDRSCRGSYRDIMVLWNNIGCAWILRKVRTLWVWLRYVRTLGVWWGHVGMIGIWRWNARTPRVWGGYSGLRRVRNRHLEILSGRICSVVGPRWLFAYFWSCNYNWLRCKLLLWLSRYSLETDVKWKSRYLHNEVEHHQCCFFW